MSFATNSPEAGRFDDHPSDRAVVFVVEDDPDIGRSLTWILNGAGHEVVLAASGRELLEAYDPKCVGCLLLDLELPDTSGIELLKKIRAEGSKHPFIILTGHGDVPTAVEALHAGAVDFIEKPYNTERLLGCVSKAIARDRACRSIQRRLDTLTDRERQVLRCVIAGEHSKEVGKLLGISPRTVDVHRRNVMQKMGVDSFTQLAHGLTKYDDVDF